MIRPTSSEKRIMLALSLSVAAVIFIGAVISVRDQQLFSDFVLVACVIAIFPQTVLTWIDNRWKQAVDEHLPDLFRSIVQAQQTGMTLPLAIEEASKRHYGPLTTELQMMVNQMSWGLSFEEAFRKLGDRVNTQLMQRTVPLVIEASRSGGRVEDVFAPMGKFIQTTLTMKKERKAQTRPYVAIIYVAFYVFIFTVLLLFQTFFTEVRASEIIGFSAITPPDAQRIFLHMSLMQGFFGGLMAGKMGEGAITSGLKHALILMITGHAALRLIS
jgi:flagellar protein FlaJ